MPHIVIFLAVFIPCCALAMWIGEGPERTAAALQTAALILTSFDLLPDFPGKFSHVASGALLIDLSLAAALSLVAIRADRLWPIPVAACQWASVTVHLAKAAFPGMAAFGYAFLNGLWGYPMIILTAIGAVRSHRRRKQGMSTPPWRR